MHSFGGVSWLVWLLLATILIWLVADILAGRKEKANPIEVVGSNPNKLSKTGFLLRYNRFLIPVIFVAVVIGATANTTLWNLQHEDSFLSLALIFLFTTLNQIGIIAIFWLAGARWPRAAGALMLVLLIAIGIDGFRSSFSGSPGSFPNDIGLRILMLSSIILYSSACLMLVLAGKPRRPKAVSG